MNKKVVRNCKYPNAFCIASWVFLSRAASCMRTVIILVHDHFFSREMLRVQKPRLAPIILGLSLTTLAASILFNTSSPSISEGTIMKVNDDVSVEVLTWMEDAHDWNVTDRLLGVGRGRWLRGRSHSSSHHSSHHSSSRGVTSPCRVDRNPCEH
jgi:hypothetical protein